MKIGINATGLVQSASADKVTNAAIAAEHDGFDSFWIAEHPTGGFDALTVLALAGQQTQRLELGTAIVPTHPRHPMVLAGQAQTAANSIDGKLTLGIGLSHAVMMENLGYGFDKPIRHLREYLEVLMALLETGACDFKGEVIRCTERFFQPPEKRVEVLVAALGPQALAVTGRLAHGTTLAWVGPRTVSSHIAPRIREAASKHGRDEPRIVATLPVCVTGDPDGVREMIGKGLKMYGQLPSYRAMFDREAVSGPQDVAIVGSRDAVTEGISAMRDAGVTDFTPTEFCRTAQERHDTRELLKALAAAS